MTAATDTAVTVLSLHCEQRTYAPYDPFHGTNAPMLWRSVTITTPKGTARLEQTDYGHPGRLNDWQPRGIDAALQPRSKELIALATAATAV
jgi:hypothetical protein